MSVVVFIIAYRYVHLLTLFLSGGIFAYWLTRTILGSIEGDGRARFLNKYSVMASVAICLFIFLAIIPFARSAASFFLSYTPPWAVGPSAAQNRLYLFEFVISAQKFPLAGFFLIGAIQLLPRKSNLGWIPLWLFLFPIFILSFVFTHRVPTYLFFVYPFFLMIASYGFMNILDGEITALKKHPKYNKRWIKWGFIAICLGPFLISPWFRIALHIPFAPDGVTNLAVTPQEWREAGEILAKHQREGDVIVTSLPQVAEYYGIRSDYMMNWMALAHSKEQKFMNEAGRWTDVYSGIPFVEALAELGLIVQNNPRGWILVSSYNLDHSLYMPKEVIEFLNDTFETPMQTKNGSVLIYHWHPQEAAREH